VSKWRFVQTETRGYLLLVLGALFGILVPLWVDQNIKQAYMPISHVQSLDFEPKKTINTSKAIYSKDELSAKKKVSYFYFDPNKASVSDFQSLGLPEYLAKRIDHYRQKGGRFKNPESFAKIYGLKPEQYQLLLPYIKIEAPASLALAKSPVAAPALASDAKPVFTKKIIRPFDINKADTTQLIEISGVGGYSAKKILNFRNALGGFVSKQQILETRNIPQSVFESLLPMVLVDSPPKKLNINTATVENLDKHPYISIQQARVIVAYRAEHGPFQNFDDLKKIKVLNENTIASLLPYISFN
jgi:competence protein ComEA